MSTKVTVTNDDFTVVLPCEMLVRDAVDRNWLQRVVTGHIGDGHDFPWRTWDNTYKYAKPIEEPKMIPYDKYDALKLFEENTIVRVKSNAVLTRIESFDIDSDRRLVWVSEDWHSLEEFLREYTQADGHKFQKESN
jgi:hypothetical protein